MEYRQLGQTDLHVSALSFGAATFGDAYGGVTQAEANEAVASAVDAGINLFDTSPFYGDGQSEHRLGLALHGKREQVIIATKAGQAGTSKNPIHDMSASYIRQSVDASLRRLQTDVIDICQLHDIDRDDPHQLIHESLPTLLELKQAGKIRTIGITGYHIPQLIRVAQAFPVDVILTFCHYSLLDTTLMDELLPFARSQGIAVMNASPLYMGVLTDDEPPPWHPVSDTIREAVRDARTLCKQHDTHLSDVALQFAYANPHVATTLIGMKTHQQVQQNLQTLRQPLNPQVLDAVQARFAPVMNQPLMTP